MSSFTSNVNIAPLPKENLWITTDEFCFWTESYWERRDIIVWKWFVTDAGSIPRLLQRMIPKLEPRTISCYVLHDYIYIHYRHIWKIKADLILIEALGIMEVPLWKIILVWIGLTLWWRWVWYKCKTKLYNKIKKRADYFI